MRTKGRILLLVDASANLLLGVLLVSAPAGTLAILGLPHAGSSIYPIVLGAVLIGISAALLIETYHGDGLGIMGAIAVNLAGALGLIAWLVVNRSRVPTRGRILLWILSAVVLGIAAVECWAHFKASRTERSSR